jgi:hypothetical protein
MEVVFGSDASARTERFQLNWLEHFHTFRRGSNLNWVGRFSASRGLQLINILHIPNTAPFFFFVLDCVMRVTMRAVQPLHGQEATAFKSVATLPGEGHPESGTLPIRLAEGSANFDCQFSEVRKELREIGPGESALRPGLVCSLVSRKANCVVDWQYMKDRSQMNE